MAKVPVLQSWYGLADEPLQWERKDRLAFQNLHGDPSNVPDGRTKWLFKERISEGGKKDRDLWGKLQGQLKRHRVPVKRDQLKDTVFIEFGGLRMEGQHKPITKVVPHTSLSQDSTIINVDSGASTDEGLKSLKEMEESDGKNGSSTTTAKNPAVHVH